MFKTENNLLKSLRTGNTQITCTKEVFTAYW